MTTNAKLIKLWAGGVISLLTPVSVLFGINHEKYFYQSSGWNVGFGVIFAVLVVVLVITKATRLFKGGLWLLVLEIFLMAFRSILGDLELVVGLILVGYIPFHFIFLKKIQRLERRKLREEEYIDKQEIKNKYKTEDLDGSV
jgi:hypothetical protein